MFKYILLLGAIVFTFISCGGCATTKSVKEIVNTSTEAIVKIASGGSYCTGFHIGKGIVITASHCLALNKQPNIIDVHNHTFSFSVLKDNSDLDIAILESKDLDVDFLLLGNEPDYGERLTTIGFPWYALGNKSFEVGYLKLIVQGPEQRYLISDSITFRGESGGPCLDEAGKVVGVIVAVSPLKDTFDAKNNVHQHKDVSLIVSVLDLKNELSNIDLPL